MLLSSGWTNFVAASLLRLILRSMPLYFEFICSYIVSMNKTAVVRSRVEQDLKTEVESILLRLGLTPSDAIQLLFRQIQLRKGIPFEISIPNALTVKTLKDSQKGKNLKSFAKREDLYRDLGL
jgi:DNA-damage-inducible protein J